MEEIAKGQKKRILVVEDQPLLRDLLVDLLEGEGYEVHACSNPESASNLLSQASPSWPIHLVITDLHLSSSADDFSGESIYLKWGRRGDSGIPFLLLSASDEAAQMPSVLSGDLSFLAKPFQNDQLRARVRGILKAFPA